MRRTLNSAHSAHTDMQTLARRTRSARLVHTLQRGFQGPLSASPRGTGYSSVPAGEQASRWRGGERPLLGRIATGFWTLARIATPASRLAHTRRAPRARHPLMPEGLLTAAANQSDARYSSTPFASPAYRYVHLPSGVISTGTVTLPRSAMPSPSAYEKRPPGMSGSFLSPPK